MEDTGIAAASRSQHRASHPLEPRRTSTQQHNGGFMSSGTTSVILSSEENGPTDLA